MGIAACFFPIFHAAPSSPLHSPLLSNFIQGSRIFTAVLVFIPIIFFGFPGNTANFLSLADKFVDIIAPAC